MKLNEVWDIVAEAHNIDPEDREEMLQSLLAELGMELGPESCLPIPERTIVLTTVMFCNALKNGAEEIEDDDGTVFFGVN